MQCELHALTRLLRVFADLGSKAESRSIRIEILSALPFTPSVCPFVWGEGYVWYMYCYELGNVSSLSPITDTYHSITDLSLAPVSQSQYRAVRISCIS